MQHSCHEQDRTKVRKRGGLKIVYCCRCPTCDLTETENIITTRYDTACSRRSSIGSLWCLVVYAWVYISTAMGMHDQLVHESLKRYLNSSVEINKCSKKTSPRSTTIMSRANNDIRVDIGSNWSGETESRRRYRSGLAIVYEIILISCCGCM